MRRLWILLLTEFKAWRQDPITAVGGILPPLIILIAFSVMSGERPTFKIALINRDTGPYCAVLRAAIQETLSPFDVRTTTSPRCQSPRAGPRLRNTGSTASGWSLRIIGPD